LRLPHSFASGDGRELVSVGCGTTQKEASEDACCSAMARLFCADPSNIVLRPARWIIPVAALVAGLPTVRGSGEDGVGHQPLAVRAKPSGHIGMALTPAEKDEAVAIVIRKCLAAHGGQFDPSHICRRWIHLTFPDTVGAIAPWEELRDLLEPGELRTFVDSHPEFEQHPKDGGKGMIISWAGWGQVALPSGPADSAASSCHVASDGTVTSATLDIMD